MKVRVSVSDLGQSVNTVVCFWKVLRSWVSWCFFNAWTISTGLKKAHIHPIGVTSTGIKPMTWPCCSRVLSNNPRLGVSDPGFAWLLTEHSPGKCQAESDFLVCCSLPRSIRSFHHWFGIDLRPNVVSIDRGLAGWRVRLAVIWIKDNPTSTAPDKPWGRSITLLHLRHSCSNIL